MIVNARVAKLYQYLHDEEFSRVMRHVEAALDEGLDFFELEVDKLDDEQRLDLLEAFEVMGYQTVYDNDSQMLEISIE
jgi:hypothetical protein